MELTTTFRQAKEAKACKASYKKFAKSVRGVKAYGLDTPIPLLSILEMNGLGDALWCLQVVPPEQREERDRIARLFACDGAGRVLYLFEEYAPNDSRPRKAIEVSRRFAAGEAITKELEAARDAAGDAAEAAWAAAWAGAAAWAAAGAAAEAAGAADGDAAWNTEREWQMNKLREYLSGGCQKGEGCRNRTRDACHCTRKICV